MVCQQGKIQSSERGWKFPIPSPIFTWCAGLSVAPGAWPLFTCLLNCNQFKVSSGGGTSLRWKDCCRPGTAVSNEKRVNVSFTWLFECCRLETGFCCARYNHDYIIIRCFWTQGSNLCIISLQRVKYLGKKDTWELKKLQKNPARDVKLLLETEEVMVRDSR